MSVAVKWEELEVFGQFTDVLAWVARIAKADPMNEALRDETVARVGKSWAESHKPVLRVWAKELAESKAKPAEPNAPELKRRMLPGPSSPLFRRNAI